ncbi:pirin family protein [Streptomyces sp. NPDC087850]|uniref:pirin family protein n=1 Tax=Streptomyces sp. NPDC087850 TaxID=3365809 RepID=UPI0038209C93
MILVRHGARRYAGGDASAGIESLHAFSFGRFYDPDNVRFGALLACNEERLAPGAGFDEHPHSHTEIVTWVVEGELTHRDSAGHATVVRAGDLQRLGSGAGVRHAERNDGAGPLVFVQMWLAPLEPGGEPVYEVVRALDDTTPYALPEAGAVLRVRRLAPGGRAAVPDAPFVYAHVVRGAVRLDGAELGPGDSARITGAEGAEGAEGTAAGPELVAGAAAAEVLLWEMTG